MNFLLTNLTGLITIWLLCVPLTLWLKYVNSKVLFVRDLAFALIFGPFALLGQLADLDHVLIDRRGKAILLGLLLLAGNAKATDFTQTTMACAVGAGSAWLLDSQLPAVAPAKRHWLIAAGSLATGLIYEAARSQAAHDFSMANAFSSTLGTLTIATIKF